MDLEKIKSADINFLGKNIRYFDVIDSTQEEAKRKVNEVSSGTVFIADSQYKGKGTKGRSWQTEANKNIIMTIVIKPNCNIKKLEGLTINIAKSIQEAIKKLYGYEIKIKEPNDLMLNNKKICGILTESVSIKETIKVIYIGIGFNVNQISFEREIKDIATSLKKEFRKAFEREEIIIEILRELVNYGIIDA